MFKTILITLILIVSGGGYKYVCPQARDVSSESTAMFILEQEIRYEKERADYVQVNILDRIIGKGRSTVTVDVELGLKTEKLRSEAKESAATRKRILGEIEYILPGIPNPKGVSQGAPPGEAKQESAGQEISKLTSNIVVQKQFVAVIHDERVRKERLKIVKEAIVATLGINTKRGDKLVFKEARFITSMFTGILWEQFVQPRYLLPFLFAIFLLLFMFGPLTGFFREFLRTLRERGGSEITVDSKLEGGGPGAGGGGAPGELSEAELAEKKKKEEEEKKEEEGKYRPFSYVDDENLRRLIYLLSKESPEIIVVALSYLKPEYVREILTSLPSELQAEVALNLTGVKQMSEDEVMEVDNRVKQKIDYLVGGIDQLLKIIDEVDPDTRNNIFEYLRNERPEVYEILRKYAFLFEDVVSMPDQALQTVIRELKIENIARALRNAPEDIAKKFFKNMSEGAVSLVREEMDYGRPLTGEQIEEERKKIIDAIRQFEREGKIFIHEKVRSIIAEGLKLKSSESAGEGTEEYYSYGVSLFDEGKYEDSIQYFQYCLDLNPDYSQAYQYLGNAYYSLERYDEAIPCFEKVLEFNPEDENLKQWLNEFKASLAKA